MSQAFESFWVRVPASSANLGPGFDAVGVALELRLVARVAPADRFSLVFVHGAHAPSHDGFAALIRTAIVTALGALPKATVVVDNPIPLGKGLGSSAAAIVLGLRIAARLSEKRMPPRELARLATQLEGHPDNVLAALFGGIVIAAGNGNGEVPHFVRVDAPREMRALVTVPDCELSTDNARALLPDRYPADDVAFTAQRAALLAAALCEGRWSHLRAAMDDRMHQPYRAAAIPGMEAALRVRGKGVLGVALSGAGPSVLALTDRTCRPQRVAEKLRRCFGSESIDSRTLHLRIAQRGAMLSRVPA